MPKERQNPEEKQLGEIKPKSVIPTAAIFDDSESRRNIVGLFDLLLKIDRRNNPELYGLKKQSRDP